ncbi:TIGR03759 family integrating conjugative element protein [Buttiauxella selenatireducens]|uniref:TIGR03759 family integrating conjugative element protein n=1 Tax=Buttiauxella selenatireducens TaxID=3073902 RepID=A0ABY9S515_9ENTR|nr:TIGR03759 family integrating conjugative element protein [Buttiauxella sp. R73]WMY72492.1 TIGR03759 family integrating conjugative element protein [Buttiauxella sp. R73]
MKRHAGYLLLLVSFLSNSADVIQAGATQSTETPLSLSSQATAWGLTTEEWTRYRQLKQGERGIWSPSLDPLTTLGVEATTQAQRRKYADLLVEKEAQRVEKELAFQRAYDDAWKRRFPALTPVTEVNSTAVMPANRRLAVFVRQHCAACDTRVDTLLKAGTPLDIYLVDSQNDDTQLRRWAVAHHIDSARVRRREITLNHDGGRWLQYGKSRMPAVLEKQGDAWLPVLR